MIRAIIVQAHTETKDYVEYFGLSTDTKPTSGIVTGSKFTEVDTGDVYLFDETGNGTWTKVKAGYVEPAEA